MNEVTWKLTNGEITETPASHGQWGSYRTTKAIAWVICIVPGKWLARYGDVVCGPLSLLKAKGAAMAMSRALANELADRNIRVNTISPGAIIDTPGALKTISSVLGVSSASPEQIEAFSQNMLPGIPLKRFGKAADVAKAVLFLASDEAGYITGIDLVVDGGKAIAW